MLQCWHLVYVCGRRTQECSLHPLMCNTVPRHEEFYLENFKQVAVFSTTLGGTIHLHDELSGGTVHNLHNHQKALGLTVISVDKSVYNELSLNLAQSYI